ncbi:MAG: histidine-type phosphatase [Brevundimonas sp.]|nr:MAG: histidine-type phosphatase [Brevundimonas sp.]
MRRLNPVQLLSLVLVVGLGGCASTPSASPAPGALKLERVVMLMRHGVRPPTKAMVTPEGVADRPWPAWSVDYGLLTPHGYDAIRLLGVWDRQNWAARGLLPTEGCPAAGDIAVAASAKSRTQETAKALIEGMAPDCGLTASFPASPDDDVEFHPIDAHAMPIDPDEAVRAVEALAPAGGMAAEVARQAELLSLIQRALGCCTPAWCADKGLAAGCSLTQVQPGVVRNEDDRPDVGEPFGMVSTVAQTFLLEYLEGMPMSDVAWGRLSRADIERLLELHSLKFYYEGRSPYVAARAASPLATRMLTAMERGPKLTVLAGHDTNIADLGGFLDLHWEVKSYPRDNPPPGGALGFEVLSNASGQRYVRAFYRAQTMDQVRELQPLTATNPADYQYLPIPGCAEPCRLETFDALVRSRLVAPIGRAG